MTEEKKLYDLPLIEVIDLKQDEDVILTSSTVTPPPKPEKPWDSSGDDDWSGHY